MYIYIFCTDGALKNEFLFDTSMIKIGKKFDFLLIAYLKKNVKLALKSNSPFNFI